MNTARITALLTIGQLSIDLFAAERVTDAAKRDYHKAWRTFECGATEDYCEDSEDRITAGRPRWDEAIAATRAEYIAYQAAKRAAYNVKRRLANACRRAS